MAVNLEQELGKAKETVTDLRRDLAKARTRIIELDGLVADKSSRLDEANGLLDEVEHISKAGLASGYGVDNRDIQCILAKRREVK